ncbi:hypothetical protein [Sphingomonas solaris]|uniref:hypothetical protein n=1 Tax=Alterirhizorhabdus solaris TaxID=2529389 RepID=UPI0019397A91|nr:hypothetical protein [Sphingomonas solaris]
MSLYLMLGAALALAGAYVGGRIDGQKIEQGAELRADREAEAVRVRLQGQIDASATAGQTAEFKRQSDVRSFTREKETIVERPVYRNVCVDADGVGLLDRAAAVANGLGFTPPARPAADAAAGGADGEGGDGRAAVPVERAGPL